jgi:hypothetical protein
LTSNIRVPLYGIANILLCLSFVQGPSESGIVHEAADGSMTATGANTRTSRTPIGTASYNATHLATHHCAIGLAYQYDPTDCVLQRRCRRAVSVDVYFWSDGAYRKRPDKGTQCATFAILGPRRHGSRCCGAVAALFNPRIAVHERRACLGVHELNLEHPCRMLAYHR